MDVFGPTLIHKASFWLIQLFMSLRFSHPTRRKRSLVERLLHVIEARPASDRLILRVALFVVIGGAIATLIIWNNTYTASTPVSGGTIIEGLIGTPRFVNPALAVTRADLDVTTLIYAGLMKINPSGTLVPDLAESITVSDDGKTYNIILRRDVRFHDDTPLTASDVTYTIGLIQNSDLKSPLRGNWADVSVEEINEYELNIVLKEAYTPFIENFTIGILPKHIWNGIPIEQIPFSQHNTDPIGAGPFRVAATELDEAGLINAYTLKQFTANTAVKLDALKIKFYKNDTDLITAFENKAITSTVYLPANYVQGLKTNTNYSIVEEPLPRVFAVFFNQNKSPQLRDTAVRLALNAAINRDDIVNTALFGFGIPTNTPVPKAATTVESVGQLSEPGAPATSSAATAISILTKAGWTKNSSGGWEKSIGGETQTLRITLRTANTPLFEQVTEIIARNWRELGVEVQIEQFEQSDLLQSVIRPRDFEGLLFGLDMSRAVDLYPFWHSSQREDPGLNIAQYANIEVDTLLQKARTATGTEARTRANEEIESILAREVPAAFLYVPNLMYVRDTGITITEIQAISKPHERFMNANEWHTNTDRLWPMFR